MTVEIDITVEAGNWPPEAVSGAWIREGVDAALSGLNLAGVESELSVVLTDDAHIRAINSQWRAKDKPTNVLSFPAFPVKAGGRPGPMMGDIILALETIEREAAIDHKLLRHHFVHLVVHGMLHLLGYDHETEADASVMEGLETRILGGLGIADPYAAMAPDSER